MHYWMYSPGEYARMWGDCVNRGIMCLGWDELGNFKNYKDREQMRKKMPSIWGPNSSYTNDSLATWQFANEIKIGDIVFAKKGLTHIVGRGTVESDYKYDPSRKEYVHTRKVRWTDVGDWETEGQQAMKTLTDITSYTDYVAKLNKLIVGNKKSIYGISEPEQAGYKQYWWLVANPAIWSVSDWNVGEEESYSLYSQKGNKRRVYQNFLDAKVGDIVICYEASPVQKVTAIATISKETDGELLWFKKAKMVERPISYTTIKDTPQLSQMEFLSNPNGSFFKLTPDEYNIIMNLAGEGHELPQQEQEMSPKYSKADFLKDVFISEKDYDRLSSLLLRKKNLILQGAPGVGKTYAAKRLAYSIMGEKNDNRVMQVQFHQNYSYEDFVMGYKPNKDGGFELKNGMFYRFCKDAEKDREHDYFFIIDEINRGNLSKIFGELLMLIENDYRDKSIKLAYTEEPFSVPNNLYLIGMMNTADRSLAMIDYALRRRFSFFEMKPGFESLTFVQQIKKKKDPTLDNLVKAIIELNKVIENDDSLGSGFCIGHSYLCNLEGNYDLENIIEYDIIPMLREYWFDNNDRFNQEAQKLRAVLQ
ncbi:MAG: EVE domain-containing protein [Bacteroidaceae bacterium]|nr:EVE domain-containing protein [Bacteroidaceae bacterium]